MNNLYLPSDVIEHILQFIPVAQIISSNWFHIGNEFKFLLERRIKKCKSVHAIQDGLSEIFKQSIGEGNFDNNKSQKRLLELFMSKLLYNVHTFTVPVGLLSLIHSVSENSSGLLNLASTKFLNILMGPGYGQLISSQNFDHLNSARILFGCSALHHVKLDIAVSDEENTSCCGLRDLVRFLQEACDENTLWDLTLRDYTTTGQGWFGPTDLSKYRNKAFICFVRVLVDLGIPLNKLTLIDNFKPSPYMMVLPNMKRRSIYMYPEFKNCKEIEICYDIGLVAPVFAHENDRFPTLTTVEVHESHVLYKADLLDYLRNAPNLQEIRVILPVTWSRRVSSCKLGCFSNPDFSCFRAEGWCAVHSKLCHTKLSFV